MCHRVRTALIVVLFVLSLNFTFTVTAQEEVKREQIEIDGLIIDQTQTRSGHEFYQHFVTFWEAPEGSEGFNIFVGERVSPQWGSWIWIKVNDVMVYRNVLRRRTEEIKEVAKKVVEIVKGYLYQYSINGKQLEDSDIARDGL